MYVSTTFEPKQVEPLAWPAWQHMCDSFGLGHDGPTHVFWGSKSIRWKQTHRLQNLDHHQPSVIAAIFFTELSLLLFDCIYWAACFFPWNDAQDRLAAGDVNECGHKSTTTVAPSSFFQTNSRAHHGPSNRTRAIGRNTCLLRTLPSQSWRFAATTIKPMKNILFLSGLVVVENVKEQTEQTFDSRQVHALVTNV